MSRPRSRRPAFTLVEAVAVMVVLAVIGSVSSSIIHAAVRAYRDTTVRARLHEEAAAAMSRVITELRRIPLDPSAGAAAPLITSVTPSSMAWGVNSTLSASSGTLQYVDAGAPAATLATDVSALTIRCYDQNNALLGASLSGSACAPIRRISVELSLSSGGVTETLRARAFIRSTMSGGAP